jgi:hypothetical protein
MLSPLPRRSDWASSLLIHPAVSAFPDRVFGSTCASSFSRIARHSLALRPAHSRCHLFVTRITEGFSHFVTSMAAPVASGWSGCRVGLAPTGKRHLFTAHTRSGHSWHGIARRMQSLNVRAQRRLVRAVRCSEWLTLAGSLQGSFFLRTIAHGVRGVSKANDVT